MIACTAPATASAMPTTGAYYAGTAPDAARPSYLRVAPTGRHLTEYLFAIRVTCSDGVARDFGVNERRERRFGLTADGRFDFRSATTRFQVGQGRARITGRGYLGMRGTFTPDAVTLTVQNRFTAGRVTCNADIPVRLARVGSAELTGRDSVMATGGYRREGSDDGLRIPTFRTVGPARLVTGLTMRWRAARCTNRFVYRDSFAFVPLLLTARGTLDLPLVERYAFPGGYRVRLRARLEMRFADGPLYNVRGAWRATTRLYRRGKHVSTCRYPRKTFYALEYPPR